jgi:hypothetical protein
MDQCINGSMYKWSNLAMKQFTVYFRYKHPNSKI